MSAVAESVGPQLKRLQEQLALAGDVRLSQVMGRLAKAWAKARVEEEKRAAAQSAEAAKAAAGLGNVVLVVELPIRTASEANKHEHWRKKHSERGDQRPVVAMAMRAYARRRGLTIKPPCAVKITRLAKSELDVTDNLPVALKSTIDGVADWLGINDRSHTVVWSCAQEKSANWGIRIEVSK